MYGDLRMILLILPFIESIIKFSDMAGSIKSELGCLAE